MLVINGHDRWFSLFADGD